MFRGENADVITFRYPHSHNAIIIHICMVIKCDYYLLPAHEVMSILNLEIVIPTFSKCKKALFIVEYYYSYHTY
jgi:hypothetical protein